MCDGSHLMLPRDYAAIQLPTHDILVRRFAGSPVRRFAGSPVRRFAGSPVRGFAGSAELVSRSMAKTGIQADS
jgi:hypothetical protein